MYVLSFVTTFTILSFSFVELSISNRMSLNSYINILIMFENLCRNFQSKLVMQDYRLDKKTRAYYSTLKFTCKKTRVFTLFKSRLNYEDGCNEWIIGAILSALWLFTIWYMTIRGLYVIVFLSGCLMLWIVCDFTNVPNVMRYVKMTSYQSFTTLPH